MPVQIYTVIYIQVLRLYFILKVEVLISVSIFAISGEKHLYDSNYDMIKK